MYILDEVDAALDLSHTQVLVYPCMRVFCLSLLLNVDTVPRRVNPWPTGNINSVIFRAWYLADALC